MSIPNASALTLRRKTRKPVASRRRRLLVESLEGRQLLAADSGLDDAEPVDPGPYVYDFQSLVAAQAAQASGSENQSAPEQVVYRARMTVVSDNLEVWDATTNQLLDQLPLEQITEIIVNGSDEPDDLILDFQGGSFGKSIQFDGAGPTSGTGDQITLLGGVTEQVSHRLDDASSGAISLVGATLNQEIHYSGLEPIVDGIVAANRTFIYSGANDQIVLSDDGDVGDDFNRIDSDFAEEVVFRNPTNSLTIDSAAGDDVVELLELDSSTAFMTLNVNGGSGADEVYVRNLTGSIAQTNINGGTETDVIEIGDGAGSLDPIQGLISVNGDDHTVAPDLTESVTAQSTTAIVSVPSGDRLVINDSGATVPSTYNLDATSVQRTGSSLISYATIEELDLQTSSDADLVTIADTSAAGFVTVSTGGGADEVNVTTTGAGSILIIDTGADADAVSIASTGTAGLTRVLSGDGDDLVTVTSTGNQSGFDLDAGADDDVVTIVTTGDQSVNRIALGSGQDVANIRGTGALSVTDVLGQDDRDTVNVSSDADGTLLDPNGTLAGNLDGVLGDLLVDLGDPVVLPSVDQSVTAKGNTVTASISPGNQLNISDAASVTDNNYTLDTNQFQRTGLPAINYAGVQVLTIQTGSGNDTLAVTSTNASTSTSIATNAGNDTITIATTGDDGVLNLDSGTDNDIVQITTTGARSVTRLLTTAGDDDILITTTGQQSGLEISAGSGVDVVTVFSTGVQSVSSINLDEDDDIINVRGTGDQSFTDVFAGSGNDTINVSSDADGDRVDADGNPMGNLDNLLGELCVDGNDNLLLPEMVDTITVKGTPVTVAIPSGDALNISDESSVTANTYSLSPVLFEKLGVPGIVYAAIETLTIETGFGNDTVGISGTRASTKTSVLTDGGSDNVQVDSTGLASILIVDSGVGNDQVAITTTGDSSVTRVITRADDDDVTVTNTGAQSAISVNAGTENDVVTLVASGEQSITEMRLAAGDDVVNIRGTGNLSVTDVFAGSDNDTINVSSDADGDRLNPSGDPAGHLDNLLGALCVYGNGDAASPETVASATAKGITVTATIRRGDELNISDQASVVNHSYSLDLTQFQRAGIPALNYDEIETLNIETGSGDDTFAVVNTNVRTTTRISTYAGQDDVQITSSGDFSILIVDTGDNDDTVSLSASGDDSVTQLTTGGGDDDVFVTTTGLRSGLAVNTDEGSDLVTIDTTGGQSVSVVQMSSGEDIANVRGTGALSVTSIFTESDNDTINVSSDADGDRLNPSGDPAGDLDGLLGELCVFGNGNELLPETTETVSAKGNVIDVTIPSGDQLNISDQASVTNNTYTLTDVDFQRVGLPVIEFNAVDTLNIETGSGLDTFTIVTTRSMTRTNVATYSGNDVLAINTTGNVSIVAVDTGDDDDSVTVTTTGQDSVTQLFTGRGEDEVDVTTTGLMSGLQIDTGIDRDVTTIDSTGGDSVTTMDLGTGDDVSNILAVESGSVVDLSAGDGNDTINITSTANGSLLDPTGDQTGNLDGILGDICIAGDDHGPLAPLPDSVNARQTDGDLVSVAVSIEQGDILNVADFGSAADNTYTVDATTIQRSAVTATGIITYETVETVNLPTGSGNDTVTVQSTADGTALNVSTNAGNDTITVTNSGADSLLSIDTDIGNDDVVIDGTGQRSLVSVQTLDGEDEISIRSVGDVAGIRVDTGADVDQINLNQEGVPPVRTGNAVINISAGAGEDMFEIDEVYLMTVVDLSGDADNDTFNLNADGSDPTGYLGRLNDDPNSTPTDDAVAATRQLFIDGGSNGAATTTVQQGASLTPAPNEQPVEETVPGIQVGDTINLIASSATQPLDLRYAITGPSNGVLATTTPGDTRSTVGNEVFETDEIENINIVSGNADDLMTVTSDLAFDISLTGQRLSFDGGAGNDKFEVSGTAGNDEITIGDIGGDVEPFEVAGVEFLRIEGGDGDDQLVNRTSVTSVIDALDGSDTVLGGSGPDLLTGGAGVDFLFGRGGNDVLFTDQDLGDDTPLITAGEIIDGGTETSIPPGDVCVQLDLDQIRNCEVLGDGGGIKDVLTWLRAIIVAPDSIGFQPLSPVLDPFIPAFPSPASLLAVTEPSKLPLPSPPPSPLPNPAPIVAEGEFDSVEPISDSTTVYSWMDSIASLLVAADPLDVNRDGRVSPLDALYVINNLAAGQSDVDTGRSWESRLRRATADVNRNGSIEPRDALRVINYLMVKTVTESSPSSEQTIASIGPVAWSRAVDRFFDDSETEGHESSESVGGTGQLF